MAKRGMAKESNFSSSLKTLWQSHGGTTIKYHGGRYSEVGVPDRWFSGFLIQPAETDGFVRHSHIECWLELKTGNGRATPLQLSKVRSILRSGSRAGVLRFAHDRRLYMEVPVDCVPNNVLSQAGDDQLCETGHVLGQSFLRAGPRWPCQYNELFEWFDDALLNPPHANGQVVQRGSKPT